MQLVFNRVEQKYKISEKQYKEILKRLPKNIKMDQYGLYTICNIYYDTPNDELIQKSLEKPAYKEKIRVRSYGTPKLDTKVFLEIKKKCNGIVNKRRIQLPLKEVYDYVEKGIKPNQSSQIVNELDYFLQKYDISKKIFIAYDREAFFDENDDGFRLTFDRNIRSRDEDVRLENGDYGINLLNKGEFIMELKANGAIPMWLVKILSDLKIYPTSFSKYGEIYKNSVSSQFAMAI